MWLRCSIRAPLAMGLIVAPGWSRAAPTPTAAGLPVDFFAEYVCFGFCVNFGLRRHCSSPVSWVCRVVTSGVGMRVQRSYLCLGGYFGAVFAFTAANAQLFQIGFVLGPVDPVEEQQHCTADIKS